MILLDSQVDNIYKYNYNSSANLDKNTLMFLQQYGNSILLIAFIIGCIHVSYKIWFTEDRDKMKIVFIMLEWILGLAICKGIYILFVKV